jgi:lipopolysaccharide/colanic/teichoic acid biosynthesis glycosyltransferase
VNLSVPMKLRRRSDGVSSSCPTPVEGDELLSAPQFRRMLALEQRRCVRSGRRVVLMLVECATLLSGGGNAAVSDRVLRTLAGSIRDTDIRGWYEEQAVFGVIFTELGSADSQHIATALSRRITQRLTASLGIEMIRKIGLSFHVLPEEINAENGGNSSDYASLPPTRPPGLSRSVKRAIDISGSLFIIFLSAPLLLMIALAVKLTSSGPVLFRQTRIGRNGRCFTFLKFRSMHHGNDSRIHEEFVTRLIKGELEPGTKQFKIVADPRITSIGRLLRTTSLDELPQLFNVVMGDMSLVGPRPPVPYEFERYKTWHRQRLSNISPGITGLWQVNGRSRVGFDDMVRLDLRYARTWSLWLDFKILLQTPRAVVSGNGAH